MTVGVTQVKDGDFPNTTDVANPLGIQFPFEMGGIPERGWRLGQGRMPLIATR
jgi:hypothetical protein